MVKRYEPHLKEVRGEDPTATMLEWVNGDWVEFGDYDALASELAATKNALAVVQDTSIAHAAKQNDRIRSLEAALREALDTGRLDSHDKFERLNKVAYASETPDECSTCGGTGKIDETLGGIATSNPHASCPDCTPKPPVLTCICPAGVWPRLPHCPVHAEPDQPERDHVDTLFEEANSGFGSGSDEKGADHG